MDSRRRTRRAAQEALALRRWVLRRMLAGTSEPPPPASPLAWRVMLGWERCAVLLQESLLARPVPMHDSALAELRGVAMAEVRRQLSARAQMRVIAEIARQLGIRVVVLKGTADVARGLPVPIMDVDVLAVPEEARALAAALDARGFLPRARDTQWHLKPRTAPDAVYVEVHTAVTGFPSPDRVPWAQVVALGELPPLLQLAPHHHAWTVLNQAMYKHPERRSRVRDLLMLRDALGRCDPAGIEELHRLVAGDLHGAGMRRMLAQAAAAGEAEDEASLRRQLRLYLMQARAPRGSLETLRGRLWIAGLKAVARGPGESWRRFRSGPRILPAFALALGAAWLLTLDAESAP